MNIYWVVPHVKKRDYDSPTRQARAAASRAAIIAAASKLFLERGYRGTTTAAIAEAAHTSEALVFSVFGSKAELLVQVVTDHVTRHPDFPLRDQPAFRALAGEPDGTAAIEALARIVRGAHDRSWRLLAMAAAAGQDDPVVGAAVARGAEGRHKACGWFVREVIGISGPEADRKTDEVWTVISVENYRHLVTERHWPAEKYEAWLAMMVTAVLR